MYQLYINKVKVGQPEESLEALEEYLDSSMRNALVEAKNESMDYMADCRDGDWRWAEM